MRVNPARIPAPSDRENSQFADLTASAGALESHGAERRNTRGVLMSVDVLTEIEIQRGRAEVAAYAADPGNAPEWYENIESAEWETPAPLAVGSRIKFVARFMGRRLAYTYEIRQLVPGARLVMSTGEGAFPMETTYTWTDVGAGATKMTLRNRGEPTGFAKVGTPLMEAAMRRANRKDLERLKEILELRG
jgi:hypothetical protein